MNAIRSDDSDGTAPISGRAWQRHVVAVLMDPDAHSHLVAAPARRAYKAARVHAIADPSETGVDTDQRGIAAPEGQA